MMGHMHHWITFLSLFSTLFIGLTHAFQCQSCSYSYSKETPNADTACINKPGIYTGRSVLKCHDYCVVQEIYSRQKQRVVAYWRSCSDKAETGFCTGDPWLLTCHHSCQGDLCNSWVRGQLHELYGDVTEPENSNNHASSIQTSMRILILLLCLHLYHISNLYS